jgi:hypothetical protein
MKKFRGIFCKILRFQQFSRFMELFSLRKIRRICPQHHGPDPPSLAHGPTDFIKRRLLVFGSSARIESSESVSLLRCLDLIGRWVAISSSQPMQESPVLIWQLRRLASARGGVGSCSRRCVATERGGSPEFEFSWATVVGFHWGLLLRNHNDEGNIFILTLIDGERQRSPTTVGRLGRCLSMVSVASGEASAPRTCAKASSSSLLASWLSNYPDQQWKTRIWWLPRVRRVLDLRPKTRTLSREDLEEIEKGINAVLNDRLNEQVAHAVAGWATLNLAQSRFPIKKFYFFFKSIL